ncbi:MAG: lysyl oxidase family protein [Fimbriimonadaceae bacterium]
MNTLLIAMTAMAMGSPKLANDKLPDVSLLAYELASAFVSTNNSELPAGTRGLRFNTASVNWGIGRLEIRGGTINGNTQLVNQRVFRTDGTFWDRPAGSFTYHPQHGHIHFDDWTVFRLKEVTPGNGVGATVAQGAKTSFCILELRVTDANAPGHNESPSYTSCGQIQGLRPGWADIYGSSLFGQVINLTGVPDGIYWLEGDIDPNNLILESDETNNKVRVQVAIGPVPPAAPDVFEENDSIAQVNARPVGGVNSPNMGLILNETQIGNLSMEDTDDWYKVKLHASGTGTFVQMESPYLQQSDLDLQICSSTGAVLRSSTGNYSWENVSLDGLPAGDYFIRVFKTGSGNNPYYRLTISPTPNNPPTLNLNAPEAGLKYVERSLETFPIIWNGGDPDLDPKYVSILRSRQQGVSSVAEPISGYQNMPNASGMVNMNTADFGLGTWYILGIGTDGGAQTHSWAPGAVFLYVKGDLDQDGHCHPNDFEYARKIYLRFPQLLTSGFFYNVMDMDRNGVVNAIDMELLKRAAYEDDHGD